MSYPDLLELPTPAEYRAHFESAYCRGPIRTFDGVDVRFRKRDFNHAFFESTKRDQDKDAFSMERAQRMDWIRAALGDKDAALHQGYDKKRKVWDPKRRVAVVQTNYVVVIRITGASKADFVTAFLANEQPEHGQNLTTVEKIRMAPKWL